MAKLMVVASWIAALVTSVGFSLLLGLNVVLVPMWFGIGAAVGVAARRASAWSCPVCKYELVVPEEVTEPRPIEAPIPAALPA